jgi:putative membrane protein
MINYNPKTWLQMIFAFHKSDTLRILWKEICYIAIFTFLITFLILRFTPGNKDLEKLISVYSLVGFVISLLLIFRTNTAYDRWWEGRKKWGELVNDTRNFSVKLSTMLTDAEDRDFFMRMIPNFVFAAKESLRSDVNLDELQLLPDELAFINTKKHQPLSIIQLIYKKLIEAKKNNIISDQDFLILDKNCNKLMDSLGACERIRNTPIPFSYSLFIKKFIFIYVTTLPLALVTNYGYFSVLIATFIFYVLVSIEVLAEEIEDPFGDDDNDLPTDLICEKIRSTTIEVFQ